MKKLLLIPAAIAALAIGSPIVHILRAFADQAPAIAWNVRTATWHSAEASARAAEASKHVAAAAQQLADPKTGAAAQLRGIRKDATETRDKILTRVDVAGVELVRSRDQVLGRVDTALQKVDKVDGVITIAGDLRDALRPPIERAGAILAKVDDTLPLFTDCDHNADCLFNRYQGTSKAFERAMQRTAEAMLEAPKLSREFTGIVTDAHTFTAKFTGPRSTKAKIVDGLKTGAYIGARFIP